MLRFDLIFVEVRTNEITRSPFFSRNIVYIGND